MPLSQQINPELLQIEINKYLFNNISPMEEQKSHTIGQYLAKKSPKELFKPIEKDPPYKVIDFSYIGIEIEIENIVNPKDDILFWQRKQDGSLRNNGWEYISYPIKGNNIAFALAGLKEELEKENDPIFSGRTSVHVHMNVLDMTTDQLRSLIILYLCFERALYSFVSPHRFNNIFCTPISQSGYGELLNTLLQGGMFPAIKHWHKYTGFNLLPISHLGTVEFRHMKGNLNPEDIITWINLIQSLKIVAMKTTFEQLSKEIIELNTNSHYDMITFQTFGEFARYIHNENLHKQMEQDVLFVKETLLKNKKPKFTKSKFPSSTLGKFILRKENLLDLSILKVDFSNFSLEELQKHKEKILDFYKKINTYPYKEVSANIYTKLENKITQILHKQETKTVIKPKKFKIKEEVNPNKEPF